MKSATEPPSRFKVQVVSLQVDQGNTIDLLGELETSLRGDKSRRQFIGTSKKVLTMID